MGLLFSNPLIKVIRKDILNKKCRKYLNVVWCLQMGPLIRFSKTIFRNCTLFLRRNDTISDSNQLAFEFILLIPHENTHQGNVVIISAHFQSCN